MKVKFRQSGGIAGQHEGCDLNASEMEAGESRQLADLVRRCRMQESFESLSPDARDQLEYMIEIDDEDGNRRLVFDELNVPESCEKLLDFLRKRSKWVPLD